MKKTSPSSAKLNYNQALVINNLLSRFPSPDHETTCVIDYLKQVTPRLLCPKYRLKNFFIARPKSHFELWDNEYERHAIRLSKLANEECLRLLLRQLEFARIYEEKIRNSLTVIGLVAGLITGLITGLKLDFDPPDTNVFGCPLAQLLLGWILVYFATLASCVVYIINQSYRHSSVCINCIYILCLARMRIKFEELSR